MTTQSAKSTPTMATWLFRTIVVVLLTILTGFMVGDRTEFTQNLRRVESESIVRDDDLAHTLKEHEALPGHAYNDALLRRVEVDVQEIKKDIKELLRRSTNP